MKKRLLDKEIEEEILAEACIRCRENDNTNLFEEIHNILLEKKIHPITPELIEEIENS